jgi:hypothetical protein
VNAKTDISAVSVHPGVDQHGRTDLLPRTKRNGARTVLAISTSLRPHVDKSIKRTSQSI